MTQLYHRFGIPDELMDLGTEHPMATSITKRETVMSIQELCSCLVMIF